MQGPQGLEQLRVQLLLELSRAASVHDQPGSDVRAAGPCPPFDKAHRAPQQKPPLEGLADVIERSSEERWVEWLYHQCLYPRLMRVREDPVRQHEED